VTNRNLVRLLLVAVLALWLGGCSQSVCAMGCSPNSFKVIANVPDIGGATWTATVCRNSTCGSAQLDSSHTEVNTEPGGYRLDLQQQKSGWRLMLDDLHSSFQEGDAWSLKVVDSKGNVVVQGQGKVHMTYTPIPCGGGCLADVETIP